MASKLHVLLQAHICVSCKRYEKSCVQAAPSRALMCIYAFPFLTPLPLPSTHTRPDIQTLSIQHSSASYSLKIRPIK